MLKNVADRSSQRIGATLRQHRRERGLTLQAVADRAGLSVGFISQVERDLTAPSLSSLASIAEALDAHISDFLTQPPSSHDVSSATQRSAYSLPGAELSYERLSTAFHGAKIHSVLVHEPPGHRSEPISHRGEELHFVVEGEMTVELEGQRHVLGRGDSIHFDSRRRHSTWNHGTVPAKVLISATIDIFGDAPVAIADTPTRPDQARQEGNTDED